MANREFYDLIIIGGGPAGLSAGIYALRASMRTVLLEKASAGGQITLTDAVENYPGFKNINGLRSEIYGKNTGGKLCSRLPTAALRHWQRPTMSRSSALPRIYNDLHASIQGLTFLRCQPFNDAIPNKLLI